MSINFTIAYVIHIFQKKCLKPGDAATPAVAEKSGKTEPAESKAKAPAASAEVPAKASAAKPATK